MLIKVITQHGDTVIIDDVSDVIVKNGLRQFNPSVPQVDDGFADHFFDAKDDEAGADYVVRAITYAKDGPCRLLICNMAYICNDRGQTIEKVSAR